MRAPQALFRSGILGEGRCAAWARAVRGEPAAGPQVSGARAEGPGGGLGAAASPAELRSGSRVRAALPGPAQGSPSPPGTAARPGPAGTRWDRGRAAPGAGSGREQVRARGCPLLTGAQLWPCHRPLRCGSEGPSRVPRAAGAHPGLPGAMPRPRGRRVPLAAPPAAALLLPPGSLLSPRTLEHQPLFLLVTALLILPTSTGDQSIVAALGTYLGSNCFYEMDELCLE